MAQRLRPSATLSPAQHRFGLLLLIGAGVPLAAHAHGVSVLSARAFLEPSASKPGDKDGCPPASSSADPEEATLQARLLVTSSIPSPTVSLIDANNPGGVERKLRDDWTLDEFSTTNGAPVASGARDVDYLDGLMDGKLAAGTYYTYFNLDKTLYDQETLTNCAGSSITGDRDQYTVALKSGSTTVANGSLAVVAESSTSVDQNDLDWLDTQPALNYHDLGDDFCIRTKYTQSSANSVGYLIANIYHHADRIRLDSVDLYYYDSGGTDPGSIETGVPGVTATGPAPTNSYYDTVYFSPTGTLMPTTQSTGDHWVAEYCFTVVGAGSSRFIPYFVTQQSGSTGTWKTDSGYEGWTSEPPPINPPVLEVLKTCDASVTALTGGTSTLVSESLEVCNTGYGDAVDVVLSDSLPVDPAVSFVSATGGGTYDSASDTITWTIGSMAYQTCQSVEFTLLISPDVSDTSIDTNAGASVEGLMAIDTTQTVSDSTTETCPIVVDPYLPGLALDKAVTSYTDLDGSGALSPGDSVNYSLTYTNTGNQALTGVTLVDDYEQGYVGGISASGATNNGDTLSWSVGAVAVGASGTVSYTVTLASAASGAFPNGSTSVNNTATADSNETGPATDSESVSVAASTALALDKAATGYADSDSNGTLSPGDTVYYSLTLSNTGTAPATGAMIVDDPDEAYVASIGGLTGGTYNGDVITWSFGTIQAGSSSTVTYSAIMGAAGVFPHGATNVVNVATGSSNEVPAATDSATVVVNAAASISITKVATGYGDSDGNGVLSPGDDVYYELAYANTGNADANGASVSDDPDELSIDGVSAISDLGSYDGDTIDWSLGTVFAGDSGVLTYTVTLAGAGTFADGSTPVSNVAVIDSDETDPDSDSEIVDVIANTALAIEKTVSGYTDVDGNATLSPGDIVNYSVSITNTGDADASGVTLSDNYDQTYVASVDASASGGTDNGDTVSWSVGALASGATATRSYSVTLAGAGGFTHGTTAVNNTATADSDQTTPVSDSASVTVAAAAALAVSKSADSYNDLDGDGVLSPSDEVVYTVDYANTGNAAATGVSLVDDPDESYVLFVDSADGAWDGDTVVWSIGTLAPGEIGSVTYTAVLGDAGTFLHGATSVDNTVTLDSNENAPVSDTASVSVTAAAELTVSKGSTGYTDSDGDGVLSPGDTVHYSIAYANIGNADASAVAIVDTPDSTAIAGVTNISGGGSFSGSSINWTIGTVASGGTGTLTYDVVLASAGTFVHGSTSVTNVAVVDSNETGPTSDDETVTVEAAANLIVSKSAVSYTDVDENGILSPGDSVQYTVTWANNGNAPATGVSLSDDPDEIGIESIVDVSDLGIYDGDVITWGLGTVAPGEGGTFTYTAELYGAGGFLDGETAVDNTVVLSSNETAPATDSESVTVTANTMIAVDKSVTSTTDVDGDGTLSPGDIVSYSITVSNTSNADATGVTISDNPDDAYVGAIGSISGGGVYDGATIEWTLGSIANGSSATVTYDVTVASAGSFVHGSTVVANTATADSIETGAVTDGANVTVVAAAELTLVASIAGYVDTDGDGVLSPGDAVTWQLDYENVGNAAANNAVLTDTAESPWVASVGDLSGGGTAVGLDLTWNLGTLSVGETGSVTWVGTLGAAGVFPHGDTTVTDAGSLDSDETAPVTDAASTVVTAAAALAVDKSTAGYTDSDGNGVLSPGDTVHYAITYANTGNAAASSVTAVDDPDETALASVANISGGGAYDGDTITWSIGIVDVGGGGTLTYDVVLGGAGTFLDGATNVANVVVIDSTETTPVEDDWTVTVTADAELVVAKTTMGYTDSDGNGVLSPGDVVNYQIEYANVGDAAATSVLLTDDPDETWVASVGNITGGGSYDGSEVSWSLATLAAGGSGSVTYDVTLAGAGTFADGFTSVDNIAVLSSVEDGPVDDTETVEVTAAPILVPTKSVSATEAITTSISNQLMASSAEVSATTSAAATVSVTTSTRLTYTLGIANTGTATANGVILQDTLPAGTSFESATGSYSVSGGVVTWTVGNLAADASETVTLSLTTD